MAEYKKGDVVMLKSGGPKMTVTEIESNGDLSCVWLLATNRARRPSTPPRSWLLPSVAAHLSPFPSEPPVVNTGRRGRR